MTSHDQPDINDDPIVAEVRRAREEIAAQFNYDLDAIFDHYQKLQSTSGRHYASPRDATAPPAPSSKKAG